MEKQADERKQSDTSLTCVASPPLSDLLSVEYHKNCHDCGQFLKKALWVKRDDPRKAHGLCRDCMQNYENPYDY